MSTPANWYSLEARAFQNHHLRPPQNAQSSSSHADLTDRDQNEYLLATSSDRLIQDIAGHDVTPNNFSPTQNGTPRSAQSFVSNPDSSIMEQATDAVSSQGKTARNVPQNSADIFNNVSGPEINWGDLPSTDSVSQKWSPSRQLSVVAIFFMLIQAATLAYAAWLIHHPYRFSILMDPFPKRLTIPIYNFIITFTGGLLGAFNLYFWTKFGARFLVMRLSRAGISYRFYERCVHWASGSIHFQLSFSLFISLFVATIFQTYAAAFTAAFGMNPVTASYTFSTPFTNLSVNADALRTNVGIPPYTLSGNDFDLNLVKLYLQRNSSSTPNKMLPYLSVDLVESQGTGGMVLGVLVGAATTSTTERLSMAGLGSKQAKLLSTNYGANELGFSAAGVRAVTTCEMANQYVMFKSEFYNDLYTTFNISSPSCGQISRVYAARLTLAYDAYSCLDNSTILTGIILTDPSTRNLLEVMECSTTLSDAFGSGIYTERSNHFTLNQGPFKSTPMMQAGVREVFDYTNTGWIQTMGRGGSQGLFTFIQFTPLNDSMMTSMMEDAVSYMYAVGGAKLIDIVNDAIFSDEAASLYVYQNTTAKVNATFFQIGYSTNGVHKWFIVFFAANVLLALTSMLFMARYPPMPLDPINPLSMMLLAINSPQTKLLHGTSVGDLPNTPWRTQLKDWFMSQCGDRTRQVRKEAKQKEAYKGLRFQLESDSNKHLQLITYGERRYGDQERDRWVNTSTRVELRSPKSEECYS